MAEVVESSPVREVDPSGGEGPSRCTAHKTSSKGASRRGKIKWPKASDRAHWQKLDAELSQVLELTLRGDVASKLRMFGEIVFEECKERLGEVKKKLPTAPGKGRRGMVIEQLVRDRRQLRRNWRKATPEEKAGLKELWDELRQKLARLRRVERIRRRRKKKEKERTSFFRDPFKYAWQLLDEKRRGKLNTSKEELESYMKSQYSDNRRASPLGPPGHVPHPNPPTIQFDISPPKLQEVEVVIKKARSASAPGPNGLPYKLYKNCPQVVRVLWRLMRTAWRNKEVPAEWQQALGVFIPKEENSCTVSQFRSIALLNVEGKIFFSVLARRMTNFLMANEYIDTSCQKVGIPGFPGCIEHSSIIWEQIQQAKRERQDLHVVWLDLANAYGSVPHKLIDFALDFFYVPMCVRNIIARYFDNLHMCFLEGCTTGWQQLERGIAIGCAISPILFVTAFEVILRGARQVVGGIRLPSGERLPPLRSYMDDVTTILQTAPCTTRLLKRFDELISWARMKVKAAKSRSLSIRKGVPQDKTTFVAGGEPVPQLAEKPLKSLGRQYTADLSDRQMGKQARQQLAEGLGKIDQSQLPGKHKVWCYQHTLYQRVMWPLKTCEVPMSEVSRMDSLANRYIGRWMGLPRCFSDAGLFGWNMLELPLKSISLRYKQEKTRLVLEMRDSTDHLIRGAKVPIRTGRKWKAPVELENAISSLQYKEVMGAAQTGRSGLGWTAPRQFWSKATKRQRNTMVVDEVTRVEQERFHIKAITQGSQAAWMRWEAPEQRCISWADIWRTPQGRLSFLIRAVYNILPCPRNLTQWFGSEVGCPLSSASKASLQHILAGCKVALAQGRFRWRHDQVLAKLAELLEGCRVAANRTQETTRPALAAFVKPGEMRRAPTQEITILGSGKEWQMLADLRRQLMFPREIVTTTLRPDIVMWSAVERAVHMIELTIPWEEGMTAAHERKHLKYSELAAECQEAGWRARVHPVEVGSRGFVGKAAVQLLRRAGLTGSSLRKAVKELGEEAEKASYWLWLRRKESGWGLTSH
uniref:Reverse transcriptase domain-containing protein n=1 Tax=Seriola lalandi dorsalis TaxID=1841481 RepID=A0A3B4XDA6_SERLL